MGDFTTAGGWLAIEAGSIAALSEDIGIGGGKGCCLEIREKFGSPDMFGRLAAPLFSRFDDTRLINSVSC